MIVILKSLKEEPNMKKLAFEKPELYILSIYDEDIICESEQEGFEDLEGETDWEETC